MDSKSFAHLDPKLKETYARVMGTDTNNNTSQPLPSQGQNTPGLSSDPNSAPSESAPTPVQNQFIPQSGNFETNTAQPTEPSSFSASPYGQTPPPQNETQENPAPTNDAFFANSSPAESNPSPLSASPNMNEPMGVPVTDATQNPVEPYSSEPVTPYTPEGMAPTNTEPINETETMAEPLPSPASVSQQKEVSPLLKVLYIVGAVIFFAIYTIFWIKVFNLPFLF